MSDSVIRGSDGTGLFPYCATNAAGQLIVAATYPASLELRDDPGAVAASRVVSAVPAVLAGLLFRSSSAADRYLQLFNAAAVPADGAAPSIAPVFVPAGGQGSLMLPASSFAVGLCWASSSTMATKTVTLAADLWVTTFYHLP